MKSLIDKIKENAEDLYKLIEPHLNCDAHEKTLIKKQILRFGVNTTLDVQNEFSAFLTDERNKINY